MGKSKKKSHSKSHKKRRRSNSSTDSNDSYHERKSKHRKYSRRKSSTSSSSSSEWSTSPERSERSRNEEYREKAYKRKYHRKSKKSYHHKKRRHSSSESSDRDRRYRDEGNKHSSSSKHQRSNSEAKSPEREDEKKIPDSDGKKTVSLKQHDAEFSSERHRISEYEIVEQKKENEQGTLKYVTTLNSGGSSQGRKIEIKISSKRYGESENRIVKKETGKTDLIGKWEPVEEKSLKAFTELCKTLAENAKEESDKDVDQGSSKVEEPKEEAKIRHPFQAPPPSSLPVVPMNPAQAIQAGMIHQIVNPYRVPTQNNEIQASFPVSSGAHHRAKEVAIGAPPNAPVFEEQSKAPVNISAVIAERLQVQKKLSVEPFNVEAIAKLRQCDEMIKTWSKSGVKPEQFTGEKTKNILSREELEGGYNAWLRKDFLNNLQPIRDGPGLRLLQKMGWTHGQPLGKNRAGFVNPLSFEIRTDRRGLSTADETVNALKPKRKGPPVVDVQGKHPVSALSEYCTKQKWPLPDFKLIMDSGPSHHKNFIFKVIVNGQEFTSTTSSPTKKNAKAQAATVALKKLGLIT